MRCGAVVIALTLTLGSLPARADDDDTGRALRLLQKCDGSTPAVVAQAEPSGAPAAATASPSSNAAAATTAPTPTPSASPTPPPLVGPPLAPGGPQILVPAPLPTSAPVTPPPLPPTAAPVSPPPQTLQQATIPPEPTPVVRPTPSAGPIVAPSASPTPTAAPQPANTLGPNDYAILGDHLSGNNGHGKPEDLDGHVTILYQQGVIGADHAHFDGDRYIDLTGHTFLKNAAGDTVFYADSIRFDTLEQHATLLNGRGESTEGVEQGKVYFKGLTMVTDHDGVTHVNRANVTTCENPRGGYHIEAKTADIYPGDKAVLKSDVLYLGALAILYLPIVVISLRQDPLGSKRNPGFVPLVGYSQAEGFWIKARIGFSPSDTYYGYYRVEEFTKIGLGLGYVATLARKDGRRQVDVNFYTIKNRVDGSQNTNLAVTDQEAFSRTTHGQIALNYTGDYGPLTSLPAQYTLNAAVDHADARGDHQDYSFSRSSTGSLSSTDNYGITDHIQFSQSLQNDIALSYTTSTTGGYYGIANGTTDTLHFESLTHYVGRVYDYDLTYDRYDSNSQTNVQKEPELTIRPLNDLFPNFKIVPITEQYTIGLYDDPTANLQTGRAEARLQLGPALAHVLASDFSAQVTVQQDYYGTGDEKAQIGQLLTLTTPLFNHIVNTISYTESNTNGPLAEPFKSLDVLGPGLKQANDVLRLFNMDTYTFSLTATTFFNREAQAVGYALTSRPSPRSTLLIGGDFTPGPGFGFDRTSVQIATPFGYQSDLQIATFIDWKNHMRLESKNIYYRHVVGNCYELRASYNEDLKQVFFTVTLLAFPSEGANFGIGQSPSLASVIPGSLTGAAFTYGSGGQ
jgi:hypothetical protein